MIHIVHTVARFQQKFIKKSIGASGIWMWAKRPSCISCLGVSNANIVVVLLLICKSLIQATVGFVLRT
jgi:hypothetical protein